MQVAVVAVVSVAVMASIMVVRVNDESSVVDVEAAVAEVEVEVAESLDSNRT